MAAFGLQWLCERLSDGRRVVTGGGAYDLATDFVKSSGGFSCLDDVLQGPLSVSINPDDPGPRLAGQGVRWDTASLPPSTRFQVHLRRYGSGETAVTDDTTAVLHGDFYRAGDGVDKSFTAPDIPGLQNLWVLGVGCGTAIVNFNHK